MSLTTAQRHFFDLFGYLHLPGVLKNEIGWITEEFEHVWATSPRHGFDGNGQVNQGAVVPYIDQSPRLCELLDHPLIEPAVESLLGADYNYLSSDGRPYSGDTGWHPDGSWDSRSLYLKVAFYLDPLTRDTGALRVIPGSHRLPEGYAQGARDAGSSDSMFGIPMSQVPSVALETVPGDLVIFNHNTMHASFGGGKRRRMFTMNLGRRAVTPEQIKDLEDYIGIHLSSWGDRTHGPVMLSTATPRRMRHLSQVIAHEGHLAALRQAVVEQARERRQALTLATAG